MIFFMLHFIFPPEVQYVVGFLQRKNSVITGNLLICAIVMFVQQIFMKCQSTILFYQTHSLNMIIKNCITNPPPLTIDRELFKNGFYSIVNINESQRDDISCQLRDLFKACLVPPLFQILLNCIDYRKTVQEIARGMGLAHRVWFQLAKVQVELTT